MGKKWSRILVVQLSLLSRGYVVCIFGSTIAFQWIDQFNPLRKYWKVLYIRFNSTKLISWSRKLVPNYGLLSHEKRNKLYIIQIRYLDKILWYIKIFGLVQVYLMQISHLDNYDLDDWKYSKVYCILNIKMIKLTCKS